MKFLVMCILPVLLFILLTIGEVRVGNEYIGKIQCYKDLANASGTIKEKSALMDKYVVAVKAAKLSPNNALYIRNGTNSRDCNIRALDTRQERLHAALNIEPKTAAYQLALKQLDETKTDSSVSEGLDGGTNNTFYGCWLLANKSIIYWDWVNLLLNIGLFFICVVSIIFYFATRPYRY